MVHEWLVESGEKIAFGQELLVLTGRNNTVYTVTAPREGIMSMFTARERDRVEYGDTPGYVLTVSG